VQIRDAHKKLLPWLRWNYNGRRGAFHSPLIREVELDTTTQCFGLSSCRDDCTYRFSRNLGLVLPPNSALNILERLRSLGLKRVVFSGGGEPLNPQNPGFPKILKNAAGQGWETELLTNGLFLSADRLSSILPFLKTLRISIPPLINHYHHLANIEDKLRDIVHYRDCAQLKTRITASLLIRPDTPEAEIKQDITVLINLGFDLLRFKPTHVWRGDGQLYLDIPAYRRLIQFIVGLNHPKIIVAKIDQLLDLAPATYPLCYFADFNPFVIGANGLNYACCEHKYQVEYERPDPFSPVTVRPDCFAGCKGDLANRLLDRLVKGYAQYQEKLFGFAPYLELADLILPALIRSHPQT
jgi:hypothetical protein